MATPRDRTGMHTTALVVKVGAHTALLYYSSRRPAGETLPGVLAKREAGRDKPRAMADAWARNEVAHAAAVLRCPCLAHGRRKCSDLAAVLPHACPVGLDVLRPVFAHAEQTRQAQLRPAARLASHQAQRRPRLDGLQPWLDRQSDAPRGAPQSARGKAIGSMPRHGVPLTRFLAVPGAPRANTLAERAWKLFSRQRNTSLFYKNAPSASMASGLTRLIATCRSAGGHAGEYLVALQEHRHAVFADPAAWLPWG